MAANFPSSLPSIARVLPTDYMNDPGKEADVLHNDLADEVEALATVVGVTGSVVPGTVERRLADVQGVAAGVASDLVDHAAATHPHAQYLRAGDVPGAMAALVGVEPSTIGWDYTKYPISPAFSVGVGGRCKGSAGMTPEALFDRFSVARTAPTNTYYVNVATGSDSNAGTSGAKFKSIKKAIDTGNLAAAPYKVFVSAGQYDRANTFVGTGAGTPTQDCAFIAVGGIVVCGSWDTFAAPSLDGTYTNCYTIAVTNVLRCLDLAAKKPDGTYQELQNVATAELCNLRPGSWASVAGTVYVNRSDGAAVTVSNTRLLRQAAIFYMPNGSQVSAYIGSDTDDCGWEMQGSDTVAALRQIATSQTATDKALVVKNCAFRYAGGLGITPTGCVSVSSYPGITAFFECDFSSSFSDGLNIKNSYGCSPPTVCLSVNCTGRSFGKPGGTSCNGYTLHNDVVGIDICGEYIDSAGGTVHNINTSKCALIGTTIADDAGDLHFGGTIKPTAVRAADTAIIEMYACTVDQKAGLALHADGASSIVHDAALGTLRTAGNVTQRA